MPSHKESGLFISLDNAQIFTTSFGPTSAPAFLALGGWIGSWEDWLEPLSLLSHTWHTLSYDHRGSGITIAPLKSLTYTQLVDDVFAVLDAYGVERCILAAMSMGAAIAFGAALKNPHRFSGLVIVNGAYYWPTPPEQDTFLAGLQQDYSRTLDRFVHACVPEKDSDHIKRWGRRILDRASPEAAIALYRMAGTIDLRDDLSRITLPTLIVHGDADTLVPVQSARWLAETLPNSRLVIISGAGHVPIMTQPAEVVRAILGFFGK